MHILNRVLASSPNVGYRRFQKGVYLLKRILMSKPGSLELQIDVEFSMGFKEASADSDRTQEVSMEVDQVVYERNAEFYNATEQSEEQHNQVCADSGRGRSLEVLTFTPPEISDTHEETPHELSLGPEEAGADSDSASEAGMEVDQMMCNSVEELRSKVGQLDATNPYVIIVKDQETRPELW